MGKKTKKEKIIADSRRKMAKISFSHHIGGQKNENQPSEEILQTQSLYIYPVQLIRKDLTKTFLLSILAISFEIALFLLLEKHLVLPFKISF